MRVQCKRANRCRNIAIIVYSDQLAVHPMALGVYCQFNQHDRPFAQTATPQHYLNAAESGRKKRSPRVRTRFAPESEDRWRATWGGTD